MEGGEIERYACSQDGGKISDVLGRGTSNQQIPSLWRTTSEEARQASDRSKQDTDLGSYTGQVGAPDGKTKKKGNHEQQQFYSV